jgi:hypothetical protein
VICRRALRLAQEDFLEATCHLVPRRLEATCHLGPRLVDFFVVLKADDKFKNSFGDGGGSS